MANFQAVYDRAIPLEGKVANRGDYLDAVDRTLAAAAGCRRKDLVEALILLGMEQYKLYNDVIHPMYGRDETAILEDYSALVREAEAVIADALQTCWR